MALLLGRGSAVEWLRRNRTIDVIQNRFALPYDSLEGSRRQFERFAAEELAPLTRPIQLVVWKQEDRRRTAVTDCHVLNIASGTYPAIRISRLLYCSTPELTFVQMANLLDEEQLLFLGMELCGRFGIDDGLFLRPQTITPGMLVAQAQELPGVHGRSKALAIAPRIIAGAASPMEIALALILCIPREQGGYGLPRPELNHMLPVEGSARLIWSEDHITPDLLWADAKLAIEYDSELHHTAAERIAHDALRRNVLQELGYRVITVTTQHLRTPLQIERVARAVALALGREPELGDDEERTRRLSFQARMYHLGAHPEELLGILPHKKQPQRGWRARR